MKVVLVIWICHCLTLASGQLYDRLFDELLVGYNKYTLPVRSKNDTITVSMSMAVIYVHSLSSQTGDIELETWLQLLWNDFRLRWDPKDYNDITTLRIPFSKIWSPDIVLYNGHTDDEKDFNALISHDGTVTKLPLATIKSRCNVTSYYRDSTVTCSLEFGSWTYDGSLMDLSLIMSQVDLSAYRPGRWEIINGTARRNVEHYSCCPEPYIDLTYILKFRDKLASKGWSFFD